MNWRYLYLYTIMSWWYSWSVSVQVKIRGLQQLQQIAKHNQHFWDCAINNHEDQWCAHVCLMIPFLILCTLCFFLLLFSLFFSLIFHELLLALLWLYQCISIDHYYYYNDHYYYYIVTFCHYHHHHHYPYAHYHDHYHFHLFCCWKTRLSQISILVYLALCAHHVKKLIKQWKEVYKKVRICHSATSRNE